MKVLRKIAAAPLGSHRESVREAECELTEGAFRPASRGSSSLLLEVCVPFRVLEGQVHLEAQAHQGVRRWLENFERVTLCAIIEPDDHLDQSMQWVPVQPLLDERLTLQFLPRS